MNASNLVALCAVALLGVSAGGATQAAEPGATRATLAAPSTGPARRIIDGRVWDCDATACSAAPSSAADSQPVVRECRRAAAELGAFVSYETGPRRLTDAELVRCNASAAVH